MTRSGFATRKEAQLELNEELERQRAGIRSDRALTVGAYLDEWLISKRNLRPSTRRSYQYHVDRHIKPSLGHLVLRELRADHIDTLYADLTSGRYGVSSTAVVHHAHRVLRSALNSALKRRLIQWNAASHVDLPRHRSERGRVWNSAQIKEFLSVASRHRLHPLFHVLVYTGMRRGEAVGLPWRDVDLEKAQILVGSQLLDTGLGLETGPTKTHAGDRLIPIDHRTVEVLRRQRSEQDSQRRLLGAAWVETGMVFTREDGSWLRPNSVSQLFQKLVTLADLPRIRLHDLRHTHASMALAAGVDIKVVSERLGHSTTAITQDLYTKVVPEVARTAAEAIADAIDDEHRGGAP